MKADRQTPGRRQGIPRPSGIPHPPPPYRPGENPPRAGGGETPAATESPAEKPRATAGMQARLKRGRPLAHWMVLAAAAAGGLMIAGLMAMASAAAWREGAEGRAVAALAAMAAFGLALPVVTVGVFLEKIWRVQLRESQDE